MQTSKSLWWFFLFLETELMGKELDGSRFAEQLDLRAAFLLANAGRTDSCDYDCDP